MRSCCECAAITGGRLTRAISVFHTSRFSSGRRGAAAEKSVALPAVALLGAAENRRVGTGYFSAVVYDNNIIYYHYRIMLFYTRTYAIDAFYVLAAAHRRSREPFEWKTVHDKY